MSLAIGQGFFLVKSGRLAQGVVIACYIGTGIGNVIAVDGQLFKGSHGVSGELGHIPDRINEEPCGCGNSGCVEMLAGGKYLAALRAERFADTEMTQLFVVHGETSVLIAYIRNLAIPIATEINILDPDTVILGGGVLSMPQFPRAELVEQIRTFVRKPLPESSLCFLFSDNNGKSGVIGAGLYAIEQLGQRT